MSRGQNVKQIGNTTEQKFLELIGEKGYWCHLFSHNKNGQPCDIIAVKNDTPWFIDVKHCNERRFEFKNIQSNQKTCFEYSNNCGNEHLGFAIYFELTKTWRWLSYECYLQFDSYGFKSVNEQDCESLPL